MQQCLRTVVMWLIVLALPAQGLAAAATVHSVQGGQHEPPVAAGAAAPDHHHSQANPHGHAHGESLLGCNSCAPCCAAMAPPSSIVTVAVTTADSFRASAAPAMDTSFLTDAPERPPRPVLA
jgi:hypothetical protein